MSSPKPLELDPGRALVLGGGGVTGIAWMTGLLRGLRERGVDLTAAERVIGTSAGSVIGAQVTSGTSLAELHRRQVEPGEGASELAPKIRYVRLLFGLAPILFARNDVTKLRRTVGRLALGSKTVDPARRRAIIAERLPVHEWPEGSLGILAIDAVTGELRCFEKGSGVSLVDAVSASCAVPGVWPTVHVQGREYMDGGVPSPENALQARGYAEVLIVSPLGGARSGGLAKRLGRDVAALEDEGSRVSVITASPAARAAMGRNPLDPANRPAAARAGYAQASEITEEVCSSWV